MDPDLILDEQMSKLEGIPLDVFDNNTTSNLGPVETAETLRGEVPFGAQQVAQQATVVQQPVQTQPVMSTVPTPTNPIDINQQVANNQAAAQVVTPSQTVDVAQVNQAVIQPQKVNAAHLVDLDAAPVFVTVNQQTTTETEYLKLKEGEKTKVALLNYNATGAHVHYEQGLGYFKCLSSYNPGYDYPVDRAVCCLQVEREANGVAKKDKNGNPKYSRGKSRLFLPVVEYPVNRNDGKTPIPGGVPKLKVLVLSSQEYGSILAFQEAYPDAKTFDLSLKREKVGNNQFMSYVPIATPTIRANYGGLVEAELNKITNRTYNLAVEEFAKALSTERVSNFYETKAKNELMASQLANQPVPTSDMLGI